MDSYSSKQKADYKVKQSKPSDSILKFSIYDLKPTDDGYKYLSTPQNCLERYLAKHESKKHGYKEKKSSPQTKTILEDFSHRLNNPDKKFIEAGHHGFAEAVYLAYQSHHTLQLSVSDFIVVIGQGLANHINQYAEELRSAFVDHEGKENIEVRRDEFILGHQNDWGSVLSEFSEEVKKRVKSDIHSIIIDDTSIATPTTTIASEVNVLSAMKQYFSFSCTTTCGIPNFILKGKPEDWQKLKDKVNKLKKLNIEKTLKLGFWLGCLVPVINQVCEAGIEGKIDPEFWDSIFKIPLTGSGGTRCTGWINALFPYVGEYRLDKNPCLTFIIGKVTGDTFKSSSLTMTDLPQSTQMLDFNWDYHKTILPMQMLSGFLAVKQEVEDDGQVVYSPEIYWAVLRKEKQKEQ